MVIGFDAKRIFHNRTGLGNYSRDLVRIMCSRYADNSYLLYNPKMAKQKLFEHSSSNIIEVLPRDWFHRKFRGIWRQRAVCRDLIRDGVELFHGLTGEIPVGIRKLKIPVVVTIHDLIFLRYPKFYTFFDYKIHSMKSRYAVNNSDIVVVVSEQTRRDVIDFYGVSPEKVKVIYQGCQDVFSERFSREEIKTTLSKHGLPDNYILNVGTIEERKNILKGIMAIKETNYNMVIVGSETKYTQLIKEYIVANKMDSRVFFPKKIPSHELAMIYQGASLFLYPSLFEGFGIPIIEALYSGTPVITTVGGCFSEAGGPFSKYVDPENVEDIRVMIEEVHNNEPLRTEMIVEGEKYVQRFNTEYIGKSVNDLYQELIEQAQ